MTVDMIARSDADLLDGERSAFILDVGVVGGCRVEDGVLVRDASDGVVPAVGVTPLPKPGERVSLPGNVAVWVGTVGEDATGGFVTARVLLDGAVVDQVMRVGVVDARTRVVGSVDQDGMALVGALASVCEARASQERAHRDWVDALVRDAHERADDESYCSSFDDFMEAHQLPRREAEYWAEVEVTATVRVSVMARTADDAESAVSRSMVWDAMASECITSTDVVDVERAE